MTAMFMGKANCDKRSIMAQCRLQYGCVSERIKKSPGLFEVKNIKPSVSPRIGSDTVVIVGVANCTVLAAETKCCFFKANFLKYVHGPEKNMYSFKVSFLQYYTFYHGLREKKTVLELISCNSTHFKANFPWLMPFLCYQSDSNLTTQSMKKVLSS
jgi:hypothetical protein